MDKVKHLFKMRKNSYHIHDWTKTDKKLLKAIQSNDINRVRMIVGVRAISTTKLGPDGYSCFHVACANGFSNIVDLLIFFGADVNTCNNRGYSCLHLAAHNGFTDVAFQLLNAGADIEYKDSLGKTALHHACNKSCEDVVEVLIKNDANINAFDRQMETPLFYSSYHGHLGICKLLVENGAEINKHDKKEVTPLFLATLQKHANVCEYLLQHGADPHSVTETGMSPYKLSQVSESKEIKNLFGKTVTQTKSNSTDISDNQDNATHETLTASYEMDMALTSTTDSPSALKQNSSEGSQGSNLLDDITSSLQDPVFITADEAKKMKMLKVEILSSNAEAEYFTIDEPESLGISDRDSRNSENLITETDFGVAHSSFGIRKGADTKISLGISDSDSRTSENLITETDFGVAHSSFGTRKGADTKISHDILTEKSDTELAFFNTKSTDVDITSIYDDVLNTQLKVTPANMNEVYDDILNNQPKVTPDNRNDEVQSIKDENIYDDSDWTKIRSEPLYASIRSVHHKEPAYTFIDSLNTAPEEIHSNITDSNYEDIKSRDMKIDKNEGFPNRKEESFGDNETVNHTEYEYIITHKTTKNEKELSRNDLILTPENNELKETIQHQEDIIEKLKLEIKNLEILLSEEKEKSAIQTAKCETLQNMHEASQQEKSVRTSETQRVDMNDKNQNNLEQLEEIKSPTKEISGNDLKEEEETVVTTDSWKQNQLLINNGNQCQDSETQADFVADDKVNDLLAKNECLHFQIEQLSFQLSKVYNRFMRKDSDESIDSGQDSQLPPTQQQNDLLTLELEQLKQDYLHLQKEHQDLIHAGDILQEDYEKLLEERDKMQEVLEKVTNTKWVAQNEVAALETKNVAQKIPETINPNFEKWEQGKQNVINKHSDTDLRTSQQKKLELLEDVKDEDGLRSIQLNSCSEILQDQSKILNRLQTLKDENKKLFLEKENVIEDLEISFNENSELKQKLNAAIESYSLLEKNYTSLLLGKQNMATKDTSGLDSNNINDSSIQLCSNQQEQLQLYPYQPNERSIQSIDVNSIQQTLPNNSSEKEQFDIQKTNQTELMKVLISQLQQQLMDSEKRYQETVQTYRLHLISAIQGHIDPDVKNGLFSIIEMRSVEEHC